MTPTHYTILSLPQSFQFTNPTYQTVLKKAYHRTLLRCHPDKLPGDNIAVTNIPHSDHRDRSGEETKDIYTVDQINNAYKTLSSPSLRQEYDTLLRMSTSTSSKKAYKTGLDIIDLDDMKYHLPVEGSEETGTGGRYTRSCRCGSKEGYVLTEQDMDEVETELEQQGWREDESKARSMIIGCLGCSLWLQVDWAVCDDEEEEE
ncbi:hypothetical protein ABW20_dc0106024 [Dactylellina cionopaga]|nr:hypothetical protein ABW20_dc0106024 [Dactylellina cionopaga]